MIIVGAGLAGLLAAHAFPRAAVLERSPAPAETHRALLRFRGEAVSSLTGVPFRRVNVRKGIWMDGGDTPPSIRVANLYARKVTPGGLGADRSIWNLAPVDRFVAPDNFYEQLIEAVGPRITWSSNVRMKTLGRGSITTAPLHATLADLGIPSPADFLRAPITVRRYRVPRADLFQTIYFPSPDTPVYRASMTGDTLIVESISDPVIDADFQYDFGEVMAAFGLQDAERLEIVKQNYGKIAPIPDAERKRLLFQITHEHGVFSLGRFATWRNILLDDVVHDIAVIKQMQHASNYDIKKAAT